MKKNKLINIIIFVLVFTGLSGIILGLDLTLNKPSTFNKIIATKLYKSPANKAFVDQNFYNCVVDAYNKENRTELPYTTSLNDEQLESITDLICVDEEINDVSGLKKLPFLTYLNLRYNNLNNIDLSQNTALVSLYLRSNNLSELDLSKNTALTSLELGSNNISSIDVSKNTALTSLELGSNNIRSIDVSKNIELTFLSLGDNNLYSIDLSKNTALVSLYLSSNNLSELDLSKNTALTSLELRRNNISNINLSNNTKLESLDLRENTISSIDLSNNALLASLNLTVNKLSSIDVKNNTKLTLLDLDYNNLSSIDVSNNTALTTLYLRGNNLSSIDVSNNAALTTLNLGNNQLSTIYLNNILLTNNMTSIIGTQNAKQTFISFGNGKNISPKSTYQHFFNSTIIIPNEVSIEDFDNDIGIENLTYKIYFQEEEITKGMIKDGYIFKLYDGDSLIESNIIKLLSVSGDFKDPNFYNCVVDAYNQENKTELPYTVSLTDEQLKSITDLVCRSKKINDAGGIEKLTSLITLNLTDNNLNSIDLSKNPSLTTLSLTSNAIVSIDLSKNPFLTTLYLGSNTISNIDLSENKLLTNLNLDNNAINSIDLSNNVELETLDLYNNQLRSIDLSKNPSLTTLDLASNDIDSIDLSNNVELENLHLYDNQLSSLDLRENPNLTLLNIWNNPYVYTIVMYTNDYVPLVSPVLLHNKNSAFSNMSNENDSIFIQDGYITASKMGQYNFLIEFNHNIQEQKNNYDVVYDIYVIEATSGKYEINNEEGYIYTYLDIDKDTILNNVEINYGTKEIIDNKLVIKYDDKIVKEFELISISSETYEINSGRGYIYTGTNPFDKTKVNVTNGTSVVEDNKLKIKYNDIELQIFNITNIGFGNLQLNGKNIILSEDVRYEDFVNNITTTVITYKIFSQDIEISSGNVTKGMKLKVYYNDNEIDLFNITADYDLSLLKVDEENKYILDMKIGNTVSEIISKVDTSGRVSVIHQDKELKDTDVLRTGSKLKIELSSETHYYEIVVIGDTNGDGTLNVFDIVKINNHIVDETKKLDSVYALAANYNNDNYINIFDIVKMNNVIVGGN